jgi:hypothetical protein
MKNSSQPELNDQSLSVAASGMVRMNMADINLNLGGGSRNKASSVLSTKAQRKR